MANEGTHRDPRCNQIAASRRELVMTSTVEPVTEARPFRVEVPEEELAELRRGIGAGNAAELATYVVEKGKPFLVVVE
jgi:hypothetical protein